MVHKDTLSVKSQILQVLTSNSVHRRVLIALVAVTLIMYLERSISCKGFCPIRSILFMPIIYVGGRSFLF